MARSAAGDPPAWNPGKFAIWSRRWPDPNDDHPTAVLLRHPTAPFTDVVNKINDHEMQKVAFAYLDRASKLPDIDPRFELPEDWLLALNPDSTQDEELTDSFGWLPIGWPSNDGAPFDPLASLRVERLSGNKPLPDQTVILLASQRLGKQHFLGPGFGVRVVAHVRTIGANEHKVRITGATASLPYGDYKIDVRKDPRTTRSLLALYEQFAATVTGQIEQTLGLQYVTIRNVRIGRSRADGTWRAKLRGTGLGKTTAKKNVTATPYVFVYLVTLSADLASITQAVPVLKSALVADVAAPGHRRLFPADPASQGAPTSLRLRRPTRSQKQLDEVREVEELADRGKNLHRFPLQYPRNNGEKMKVVFCPAFVRDDEGDRNAAKTTDLSGRGPDPAIRSNDFTAVSAFKHVKQLFERLEAYGISTDAYFRLARLPLKVAYRSGVRPGPGKDGKTVNACVLPDYLPEDLEAPKKPDRPGLEMHLALANLSHRARNPSSGKPSSVEPLGIATDVRWIWHEIGHVLLMASLGELEFRFAHSPGDALAAIVGDPRSKLAADPKSSWRGVTFPWVFIPRRHDRCVLQGWSWGGSLHQAESNTRRKGYWTEQILSSSLFRLYQSLGGDTLSPINMTTKAEKELTKAEKELEREFRQIRESASHYSVYLIMRGLQLLGSPGVVPADNPDQFVAALIDADIGTHQWDVTFRSPRAPEFHRIGGCAHKVIRWAFEAQGMYGKIKNALGLSPDVDIYIADHRLSVVKTPCGDIDYGPGNYVPVPLYWDRKQSEEGPLLWQAKAEAISVQGNDIRVTVGNRGSQPANDVRVSVWCREWRRDTDPPTWRNGDGWTPCDMAVHKGKTIVPGYAETFGPFSLKAHTGKRYLVLAQATCADDRANTDTETSLPCSYLETPLIDLVAGDNNVGLRVIKAT